MDITSFLIYCVIITFTPGPTNIVILSTVQGAGIKKAMEYTYGATIAFGALLAISAILNTMLVTVIPSFVMPYYTEPYNLAIFVAVITTVGFLAFVTWVLFGALFKEFLQRYQKTVNVSMSLFLIYSAIVGSGLVDIIRR